MKRILLSLTLVASSIAFSQTLQSENFNTYTIGNMSTDFTANTPGQGSWLTLSSNGTEPTTSTNAAVTNFQVVSNGNMGTNGLQITSPNGDKGSRYMWKNGLDVSWANRTAGNNIIEIEYDFFTGAETESRTQVGMRLYGIQLVQDIPTTRTPVGFAYSTNTRVLSGVAYAANGATNGTFLINLGTTPLVLASNTWYTIGCSYNTITGEAMWKTSPSAAPISLPEANRIPNMTPTEVDYLQVAVSANAAATPPVPANTATSTIIFDNYISRASATSTLLSSSNFDIVGNDVISVYPNPAADVLNLAIKGSETINSAKVLDLNGRQIFTKTFNNVSDAQIDVNDLSSGLYLISITSGENTVTKKFLKQ
ncbi:T9SS type A sorting domain-containing protein [Flavobacterium tegetincola]|uniref:T9SS type A sorting domain-containing protein n=1 Tax=Flavobacterium tegetincola TaxID=150172 RepID=UPI00047BA2D2|nr:T9SS type A sorting domain-containing protein [Flavobacterium tegetincola]